jgi:hypothetical protein
MRRILIGVAVLGLLAWVGATWLRVSSGTYFSVTSMCPVISVRFAGPDGVEHEQEVVAGWVSETFQYSPGTIITFTARGNGCAQNIQCRIYQGGDVALIQDGEGIVVCRGVR